MSTPHDASYKLLFAHPQVVADLMRGLVQAPWVEDLDFSTLERVNASFVSDDLRERHDDVIWRLRWRGRWLYLYLVLEFQSTLDPWMAVRLLVYVGLLYQDLIKGGQVRSGERLPPVFTVVLYTGKRPWTAAVEVAELIEPVAGLEPYQPRLRYWLVEARAVEAAALGEDNTLGHIVRLEQSRYPEELREAVARLNAALCHPAVADLRRALTIWLQQVVLRRLLPGQELPEVHDLQEVETMLAETVEEWTVKWRQEGWRKGREEGLQEGQLSGEQIALMEVLRARFGAVPDWVRTEVESLTDEERLRALLRAAATAESLAAVFGRS